MHSATLAVPEFAIVLLHVIVLGRMALRLSRFMADNRWLYFAMLSAAGLSVFGFELFVIGELRCLTRLTLFISTAAMVPLWWFSKPRPSSGDSEPAAITPPQRVATLLQVLLQLSVYAVFAVIVFGCFRPAIFIDELQYHWPTPLLWAHDHGWSASPYRLSNGCALAEMLFTVGAIFNNPTVAHLTAALGVVTIVTGAGALAVSVGASPWFAAVAALSIPTIVAQANAALNDNLVAGFVICAYAAVLSGNGRVPSRSAILISILLSIAAVSTKPFAILAVLGIGCYLLYRALDRSTLRKERQGLILSTVALSVAMALTFAVWSMHCYFRTGKWWETNGIYLATGPSDPLWNNAVIAGRHPRLIDRVTTPFVFPVASTINRENQVYGNRIGPLLLLFVPLVIFGVRRLSTLGKTRLYFLLGGALFFLVVFSPTSPKTRFHEFVWISGAVAAAVGLDWTQRLPKRWIQLAAFGLFFMLFAAGLLDAMRHMFEFGRRVAQTTVVPQPATGP